MLCCAVLCCVAICSLTLLAVGHSYCLLECKCKPSCKGCLLTQTGQPQASHWHVASASMHCCQMTVCCYMSATSTHTHTHTHSLVVYVYRIPKHQRCWRLLAAESRVLLVCLSHCLTCLPCLQAATGADGYARTGVHIAGRTRCFWPLFHAAT